MSAHFARSRVAHQAGVVAIIGAGCLCGNTCFMSLLCAASELVTYAKSKAASAAHAAVWVVLQLAAIEHATKHAFLHTSDEETCALLMQNQRIGASA
jgi:hypothetical protein